MFIQHKVQYRRIQEKFKEFEVMELKFHYWNFTWKPSTQNNNANDSTKAQNPIHKKFSKSWKMKFNKLEEIYNGTEIQIKSIKKHDNSSDSAK